MNETNNLKSEAMAIFRTLNLDGMFIPVPRPEIEYELLKFSGGELHIKLNNNIDYSEVEKVIITHRIKSTDDLMAVLIAKNALELKGVKSFDLIMPYVPYARQDRKCFNGESFTLKVFTSILNSAKFETVHVFDAHSDVAPALIDNCNNHDNKQIVRGILNGFENIPILISPDAGSNKKANKLAVDLQMELVKCDKVRDTKTGALSGFEVFANDLKGKDCLIVDDICDGGGTFLGLAKELKNKGAGNIYLFVTHGIFSKGTEIFKELFSGIYCTNSFSDIESNNVKQIKIQL